MYGNLSRLPQWLQGESLSNLERLPYSDVLTLDTHVKLASCLICLSLLLITASLSPTPSASQIAISALPEWEDIRVPSRNAEPMHVTYVPSDTAKDALRNEFKKSPYYLSLNGLWKFKWVPKPDDKPLDFYRDDYDVGQWTDFPVPSNWEFKGYGMPRYRDEAYTFGPDPPQPPMVRHAHR
jgi:beta-galactosidase